MLRAAGPFESRVRVWRSLRSAASSSLELVDESENEPSESEVLPKVSDTLPTLSDTAQL
jgi:hypothetical protein